MQIGNPVRSLASDQLAEIGQFFADYQPGLEDRISLEHDTFLLGAINWRKSLGRPVRGGITAGFKILVTHYESVFDNGPPPHHIELPFVQVITGTWDATQDGSEDYSVGFAASEFENDERASPRRIYSVEVILSETVEWTDEVPFVLRRVSPPGRNFTKGPTNVWLEPFRVVKRSLVELESAIAAAVD